MLTPQLYLMNVSFWRKGAPVDRLQRQTTMEPYFLAIEQDLRNARRGCFCRVTRRPLSPSIASSFSILAERTIASVTQFPQGEALKMLVLRCPCVVCCLEQELELMLPNSPFPARW